MSGKHQTKFKYLHILLDAVITCLAYFAAWFIVIGIRKGSGGPGTLAPETYFLALVAIVPLILVLYALFGLYTPKRIRSRLSELLDILKANLICLMVLTFVLFAGRNFINVGPYLRNFSTRMLIVFFIFSVLFDALFRNILRTFIRRMRRKGFNQHHILIVGISDTAERFIEILRANPGWGYHVFGILDDTRLPGEDYMGFTVIGGFDDLARILEENQLDEVAVTLPLDKYRCLRHVVNTCEKAGVHTKFIPDYQNIIPTTPHIEDMQGLPVIDIRNVPLTRPFNAIIKRTGDIIGSGLMIIALSPLLLVVAVLIKFTSPGPVIFRQERIGMHNRPFNMYKFRSMCEQRPEDEAVKWTVKDDPRVTPVGKFIRRANIDELPQLFNIFRGDMSLVGPRPERPLFVEKFREEIPRYMIKHQVRPGLTGWAQVNGYRGDTSIPKRIEHDLYYIENWTVMLDIKILFMTLFKGYKNAY